MTKHTRSLMDNPFKYGTMQLSAMTVTFKCDNLQCGKSLLMIMCDYDKKEFFGRCNYCGSGRLKWMERVNLQEVYREQKIITDTGNKYTSGEHDHD